MIFDSDLRWAADGHPRYAAVVPDGARKPLDLSSLEASFTGAMRATELRDREQPLERLVDRLLLEAADVLLETAAFASPWNGTMLRRIPPSATCGC